MTGKRSVKRRLISWKVKLRLMKNPGTLSDQDGKFGSKLSHSGIHFETKEHSKETCSTHHEIHSDSPFQVFHSFAEVLLDVQHQSNDATKREGADDKGGGREEDEEGFWNHLKLTLRDKMGVSSSYTGSKLYSRFLQLIL